MSTLKCEIELEFFFIYFYFLHFAVAWGERPPSKSSSSWPGLRRCNGDNSSQKIRNVKRLTPLYVFLGPKCQNPSLSQLKSWPGNDNDNDNGHADELVMQL